MSKKKGLITGAAAIFAAAVLALFGISGENVIEVEYTLETNGNLSTMTVNPPEEIGADIAELYCNENQVTKTTLPSGALKSIPFVFSNLDNLEIYLYRKGEVIGIGRFRDKKLYVAMKGNVTEEDVGNEG